MEYRSLLSIADLSDGEVDALLDSAARFLPRIEAGGFKDATLRSTSIIMLFYEPSTRTRVSFELAGKMLGIDTINISAKGSSAEKGETLQDTAQTLAAMHHNVVVIRHPAADAARVFAAHFPYAVINAGSGRGQHPTQALLDAFTLREAGAFGPGKNLVVVGDIAHSRVLRSNLQLLSRRGVDVTLVAPPTLMPEGWEGLAGGPGRLEWTTDIEEVLPQADVVMMLRMQRERMAGGLITNLDEYSKLYGLSRRRLALLRPDAVIMHPGPVNRGVEVSEDVFADPRCRINDQVTAGLALRCALLCWACGREPEAQAEN
jgi:aspartate carbamoyltransferase catalytic subunit